MQRLRTTNSLSAPQLSCFETPRDEEFLFDVEADPNCLHNLAADPSLAQKLKDMRAALQKWQADTNDSFPGEDEITPDGFDRVSGKKLIQGAHPSFDSNK